MRLNATYDDALGETQIELADTCYTDASPLVRRIVIRRADVDLKTQGLPLAAAILVAPFCGDQFEFAGTRIAGDYAEAIAMVIGRPVSVLGIDGFNRTISPGEIDIACYRAGTGADTAFAPRPPDALPLTSTDWSGDFVDPRTRRSAGSALGEYYTNAALLADETLVSVAIGLIHGRDRCRTLIVPAPEKAGAERAARVARALRIVGVSVEFVPQAARRQAA